MDVTVSSENVWASWSGKLKIVKICLRFTETACYSFSVKWSDFIFSSRFIFTFWPDARKGERRAVDDSEEFCKVIDSSSKVLTRWWSHSLMHHRSCTSDTTISDQDKCKSSKRSNQSTSSPAFDGKQNISSGTSRVEGTRVMAITVSNIQIEKLISYATFVISDETKQRISWVSASESASFERDKHQHTKIF